jgi:hypothetical protein
VPDREVEVITACSLPCTAPILQNSGPSCDQKAGTLPVKPKATNQSALACHLILLFEEL